MGTQCISFPQLDNSQVEKVRGLEGEIGKLVMAVGQQCNWADLNEDQLHKLREVESQLGIILLAYDRA